MAIDTIDKRASVLGIALTTIVLVLPEGSIDEADRQTVANTYSGILADAPVIITPDCITKADSFIDASVNLFTSSIDSSANALQSNIQEVELLESRLCC